MTACGQPDCPNLSDADAHAAQDRLLQQIVASAAPVSYYFERSEGNYLMINCFGGDFCGSLPVMVQSADNHAEQLLQKGGYRGARLLGLRLHAETLGGQQVAVYDGLEKIVD